MSTNVRRLLALITTMLLVGCQDHSTSTHSPKPSSTMKATIRDSSQQLVSDPPTTNDPSNSGMKSQVAGAMRTVTITSDRPEVFQAISDALKHAGVPAMVVSELGFSGWQVPEEEFATARRALLAIPDRDQLGIKVME